MEKNKYKSLEEIIVFMPIYDSFSLNFLDESKDGQLSSFTKKLLIDLFHRKKINIFCVECKKEYPFTISYEIKKENYRSDNYCIRTAVSNYVGIDSKYLIDYNIIVPEYDEGIITYTFKCTMDSTHYYKMNLLYILKNNMLEIRKIGQKPINSDLQERHSNEYKKVLDKYDAFNDYRCYEQCALSRNLLAGACTYLRRVLEKIVLIKLDELHLSEEEIKKLKHFEDKIKCVKDLFDEDVKELINRLYGLLSKGIHELNNDEIETFYRLILEVINVQLESEKELMEREAKMKKLHSEINNINI